MRDAQSRVGWVLGRALYLQLPEEIAQYSEGQRIVAAYPLDEVQDGATKVPEYLVLFTEKEGLPYDFSQARVFTWNVRKHRYETAYRERELQVCCRLRWEGKSLKKKAICALLCCG